MTNSFKVLIYLILLYFLLHNLQISVYEIQQSQINQNFGTVCRTEVYLTFSRLGAKLEQMQNFDLATFLERLIFLITNI